MFRTIPVVALLTIVFLGCSASEEGKMSDLEFDKKMYLETTFEMKDEQEKLEEAKKELERYQELNAGSLDSNMENKLVVELIEKRIAESQQSVDDYAETLKILETRIEERSSSSE